MSTFLLVILHILLYAFKVKLNKKPKQDIANPLDTEEKFLKEDLDKLNRRRKVLKFYKGSNEDNQILQEEKNSIDFDILKKEVLKEYPVDELNQNSFLFPFPKIVISSEIERNQDDSRSREVPLTEDEINHLVKVFGRFYSVLKQVIRLDILKSLVKNNDLNSEVAREAELILIHWQGYMREDLLKKIQGYELPESLIYFCLVAIKQYLSQTPRTRPLNLYLKLFFFNFLLEFDLSTQDFIKNIFINRYFANDFSNFRNHKISVLSMFMRRSNSSEPDCGENINWGNFHNFREVSNLLYNVYSSFRLNFIKNEIKYEPPMISNSETGIVNFLTDKSQVEVQNTAPNYLPSLNQKLNSTNPGIDQGNTQPSSLDQGIDKAYPNLVNFGSIAKKNLENIYQTSKSAVRPIFEQKNKYLNKIYKKISAPKWEQNFTSGWNNFSSGFADRRNLSKPTNNEENDIKNTSQKQSQKSLKEKDLSR